MQTSGLILDLHDDTQGYVLRQIYSSAEELPEVTKTAHRLTEEERTALPDDVFALVLINGDESLRKFACIDPGHTRLSVDYFIQTRHKLPVEAQKVAAVNLRRACDMYGVEHEELDKVALSLGRVGAALTGPVGTVLSAATALPGMARGIGQNVRKANQAGGNLIAADIIKQSDASFTPAMPAPSVNDGKVTKRKAVIRKIGAVLSTNEEGKDIKGQELVSQSPPTPPKHKRGRLLTTPDSPAGFMAAAEKTLHPHIDVTGHDAKPVMQKKAAHLFALRDRYPLDNLVQVKRAAAYFEEYGGRMAPADRHEYCTNMVKRADALGIEVSDEARKYGSTEYAPAEEVKVAMDIRRSLAQENEKMLDMLDGLMSKQASVPPEVFCETLGMIDSSFGLNHHYDRYVPDPYWSTFGFQKQAEFVETIDNETINEGQLKTFVANGAKARLDLTGPFSEDMADEFIKDPVGIFKSMPREQKLIIMRLASAAAGGE